MRIQVLFGDTPVLVPCGDGKLTVRELIQKAITRFKKVVDKHPDDVIEVRSVRLADSGSFVDQDDEVADVLEDKEAVILEYYIPGYSHNARPIHISDESVITGSTEPFSTGNLDNTDHSPYIPDIDPLEDHTHLPLASIREDFVSDEPEVDVSELHKALQEREGELNHHHVSSPHHSSQDLHMVLPEASQDTELVAQQNWHSQHSHTSGSQSQEPSPRLERKTGWRTSNESDSGYAPTKSQESYGHSNSQPKSQEVYTPGSTDLSFQHNSSSQGHADFPLQNRDFAGTALTSGTLEGTGTGSQTRRSNLRKEDDHKSGSFEHPGMHKVSPFNREQELGRRSLRSNEPQDNNFALIPTRTFGAPHVTDQPQGGGTMGRGMDIPYGRGSYGGYPDRTSTALPHSMDDSFDNRARIAHQDWRRSFHSGDYNHYHDIPPYASMPGGGRYMDFHNDPFPMRTSSGRFTRPPESLSGRFLANRRGNFRLPRTISHEQMDQGVPYVGGRGHSYEDFNGPVDYYLSQPSASYFSYDNRPGGGAYGVNPATAGHVPMMGYDPRFAMSGPSGYSLSQPGVMISHGGRGMHDFDRRGPHPLAGARRGVLKSDSLERGRGDHPYSIDEEFDHLEDDDTEDGKRGRNPFRRDFRKSMFRDGFLYSQWMDRMNEFGIEESEEVNEVPEYEGENTQSQRSRTPSPVSGSHKKHGTDSTDGHAEEEDEENESEDEDEFGNVHIVELHKGEEHLGIHLTHFTSPDGVELGVFIGGMDDDGFAAKSGKLQYQDRILACNGVDFTKDLSNHRVEELFLEMSRDPLLRMAISRGINVDELQNDGNSGETPTGGEGKEGVATPSTVRRGELSVSAMSAASPARSGAASRSNNVAGSSLAQPPSLAVTNTRQIGVKHTIELTKGQRGLGFGLTSRDVLTDDKNQPIYVKSIHSGGAAFLDGRLKIGDRVLQVNDVEVTGMTRPKVVQLLRAAVGVVTIVVSRQEDADEATDEFTSHSSTQGPASLTTVDKTVLTLNISLNSAGSAGLGVTVYGKATTSRKTGDLGIYINSIMPKGAAALDGRLHKNDQILCINKQNILGRSNQEALDILRKALSGASGPEAKVQLIVARKASMSPAMPSLGERPEEEEREMVDEQSSHEVGIDCPNDAHQSVVMVPAAHSQTSLNSQHSTGSFDGVSNRLASHTSLTPSEQEPSRGSMRGRAHTFSESPSHRGTSPNPRQRGDQHRSASPLLQRRRIIRADENLGSGEFYDRLEPLNTTSPHSPLIPHPFPPVTSSHLSHLPTSSRHSYSETLVSLYDDAAASISSSAYPTDQNYTTQSLDRKGGGYNSRHAPSYDRPHSYHPAGQEMMSLQTPPTLRHHPPQMSRDYNSGSLRRALSPDTPLYSMVQSSRDSSLRRQTGMGRDVSPYDSHDRYGQPFSPYSSDSASSTPYGGQPGGMWDISQVPTRGSGRKDRNKPERGSGRNHASYHSTSSGSASAVSNISSELNVTNGYATVPRSGSRSSERESVTGRSTTPTNPETSSLCSLENLRLSDSESNTAFRRDDAGRISITKKTKKNPRQDFAHLHFDNVEPLVEGEAPVLIRTGSDGCLNQQHYSSAQSQFLQGLEVGPQLGLVKSSSLESLHNVMAHSINRGDLVDDGSDLRNRSTRNSFRRAVDHSYDNGSERQVDEVEGQRGVDVPYDLESSTASTPAVISFTKNPVGGKTKKKGFLKKVFKKRKGTKKSSKSPQSTRRTQSVTIETLSSESLTASLTPEEQEQVLRMQRFTLSLKGVVPSQEGMAGAQNLPADNRYTKPSLPHRHSMPLLDDYDSPDSPDEVLLSSMAKV